MQLFTLTILDSVERFVFSFCLVNLQCKILQPSDMPSLMWLFRLGCTPYAASTHVHSLMRLSVTKTLLQFIVCFRNSSTRFNFAFSSTVLLVALLYMNNIFKSMPDLPLFYTHSSFSTMKCKVSASFFSCLCEFSFIFCKTFLLKILFHLYLCLIMQLIPIYNIS